MRIAVVGGGISGLATAFYLQQARPEWQLEIFEEAPRLGGTMYTQNQGGFLFEAGGNGFLTNKPDTLDLVRECGAEHLLMRSSDEARIRYVFTDRLHRLPESPPAFLKTKLLSFPQKLRVLAEVVVPARKDDSEETVESFGNRRLGPAFTRVFLDAMTAGIYASTPGDLSVNAAFPLVVNLERQYGGLFRGMLKKRKKQAGPGGVLTSFTGGVGSFIDHLRSVVGAKYRCDEGVTAIEPTPSGYRVSTAQRQSEVDRVILCTPAYVSARLVESIDPELAGLLTEIDYSPIAVVGLGYDRLDHDLHGFGLLTTSSSGRDILGVLWDSSIFADRAPDGKKALRVMIGGRRNPDLVALDDEALTATALRGIRETMGCTAAPTQTLVVRWPKGIPNYRLGHLATVDRIYERLRNHPGLHLNSNAYRGIALNDCVANSRRLAREMTAESPSG